MYREHQLKVNSSVVPIVKIVFQVYIYFHLLCYATASLNTIVDIDDVKVSKNEFSILTAPVHSNRGPKIAWLMTFPGAGTTYITYLVKQASNTTSATNYGNEYLNANKESVSLYSDASGPYLWQDENMQGLNVPSTYILTKTHCGGRCQDCPPNNYIESVDTFMLQCLRAPKVILPDNRRNNTNKAIVRKIAVAPGVFQTLVLDSYDPKLVKKMIHVVKNPYDNVISRFHHEYKSIGLVQTVQKSKGFTFKHNYEGFQVWCERQDRKFTSQEELSYGYLYSLTKNVPCHAEFYRYVQWHNLAFETAEKLNINSYAFNYEDLKTKQKDIVSDMLEYLELPMVDEGLMTYQLGNFRDHYKDEQMDAVAIFIRALASEKTWGLVCRYFPDHSLAHAYNFTPSRTHDSICPGKKLTPTFYGIVATM